MKFFFPDSQDLVDPSFDFVEETRSALRVRQRDDVYPHELFSQPPYDGILVSKAMIDGNGQGGGRYSLAQRYRLLRSGVRDFFRLPRNLERRLETMGDCGAFSYVREQVPPYSVDEVIQFYEDCGFDHGISVDHVILGYQAESDNPLPGCDVVPEEFRRRQDITLELAEEFLRKSEGCHFTPMGVAQGWSPDSYAKAVKSLQQMGYRRIAMGGMVPLRSPDILACLERIDGVRNPETQLHLLGVTRIEHIEDFAGFGVTSFDSTSPLRQAFKDERDNYYTPTRTYSAIRVPQVEGNAKLQRSIVAGHIDVEEARKLEQECLRVLLRFDAGDESAERVLDALRAYECLYDKKSDRTATYQEVLQDRPWKSCPCEVCKEIGIHVILFRGAERNRRRGFHNLFVFYQRLQNEAPAASRR